MHYYLPQVWTGRVKCKIIYLVWATLVTFEVRHLDPVIIWIVLINLSWRSHMNVQCWCLFNAVSIRTSYSNLFCKCPGRGRCVPPVLTDRTATRESLPDHRTLLASRRVRPLQVITPRTCSLFHRAINAFGVHSSSTGVDKKCRCLNTFQVLI